MLHIRPLDQGQDRSGFRCGVAALDRYFHEQVTQDAKRFIANCFVALADGVIVGYYTLSSASIPVTDLPDMLRKRLPRYPVLPAVRIGRLAVAAGHQGQGVGAALLWDAIGRCLRAEAAGFSVLVEAKDERAAQFYRHHGFFDLPSRPLTLFLPLAIVRRVPGAASA